MFPLVHLDLHADPQCFLLIELDLGISVQLLQQMSVCYVNG